VIAVRYVGPAPLGEVFMASLYGENYVGDQANARNTRVRA